MSADKLRAEPEAEAHLLAACLYGRAGKHPDPPKLAPSRLAIAPHRLIWAAILDQHRKGLPYDVVAINSVLRERGQLDAVTKRHLGALDKAPGASDTDLSYYVRLIQQAAAARALGPLGAAISALALQDDSERAGTPIKARYQSLVRRADAVCDMASRNGHMPTLTVRTPNEVLSMPVPAMNWIYEPWLGAGDVVIMAGEPGLGKSWVALDLMFALALALDWAGVRNTAGPQRILYVDEENNFRLIRHRMSKLVDGMNLSSNQLDPANIAAYYTMEQGINLDDAASLELLKRKLDELRPDFIIFDSLIRIHRRDENSNADMSSLIGGVIKPMARNVGAGVIIIHHLGKATKDRPDSRIRERIRGASDLIGVADQVWGLERQDDALQLSHIKCRYDKESTPICVQLEDIRGGAGLKVTYSDQEGGAEEIIMACLVQAGADGCGRQTIEAEITESGFKAVARLVTKHLGKLHALGKVKKRKDGRAVRYWLTDCAPAEAE